MVERQAMQLLSKWLLGQELQVYGTTFVATSPGKDFGCCFEGKDLRFWLLWDNYIDCSSLIFYARIQVEWKRFNPFPFQILVFPVALICLSLCICAPLRVYSHKWLHHRIVTIVLYIEFCSPNKIYGNVQGLGNLDYGKLQVEALKVKIWTMMGMDMTFHCKLWCFCASSTPNYFVIDRRMNYLFVYCLLCLKVFLVIVVYWWCFVWHTFSLLFPSRFRYHCWKFGNDGVSGN